MLSILKAGIYKLTKDWTFRIVLIVGIALAIFLNLIYLFIDMSATKHLESIVHVASNGQNALLSSMSPVQNFGITVPINLCIYVVNEFTHGTVRNKIIAGHKKSNIYLSTLLLGLIFTISLMLVYILLSVGIGSIIGGFDPSGFVLSGVKCSGTLILQYSLISLCVYIFICSLAIFVVTIFRSVGPSIPIVTIATLILYFIGLGDGINVINNNLSQGKLINPGFAVWLDPLYTSGLMSISYVELGDKWLLASIITPLYWSAILAILGTFIFNERDVK